ncbi:hypothetical protein WJT74_07360 [Sphingomicrobium sp. XHP0239]|uniref:hypothetical protein n=1 Tax=Sphingomicrobium maritimum TaxID=3133972 RepID=UPI0031CCBB24
MRLAIAAAAALAVAGCEGGGEAVTLDGSSEEAFVASAAAARAQLPLEDRLVFDEAMNSVGQRSHRTADKDLLRRRTFDGMTAEEVVSEAHARGID